MRAKRTDSNQREIVEGLRMSGVSVYVTSHIGHGFPDLVCGYRRQNFLLEIKDGKKPKSAQKLTDDEVYFFKTWRGTVCVVRSLDDALVYIGIKD